MSALKPTAEQQALLDAFVSGGTVVIHAGAGTGKTSTLRLLSATRPKANGLYVAYNKAIQTEAEKSFPRNVECRTAHSLAYRTFGAPMRARLAGPRVTAREAVGIVHAPGVPLGSGPDLEPATVASMALRAVDRFCHSADTDITRRHFVPPEAPGDTDLSGLAATVVAVAKRAWTDLTAPVGHLKPSHDVYLKLWQLSRPMLHYDFVLFDEAQDADPAIADVVTRQASQLIAVGDSAQAIYGWRGFTTIPRWSWAQREWRTVRPPRSQRYGHADQEPVGYDHAIAAEVDRPANDRPAMAFAATADRTDGRLDAAVLAYRNDPTSANRDALAVGQAEHADKFLADQAAECAAKVVAPPSLPVVGAQVRIRGDWKSSYRVTGFGQDGSVTLIGGPNGGWRSVMPERVTPITRSRQPPKRHLPATPSSDPVPNADRAVGL